jgi:hypothetical protein
MEGSKMHGPLLRARLLVAAALLACAMNIVTLPARAQTDSDMPFWMKAISWAKSLVGGVSKQSAIRRDANLKKFASELSWIEGKYRVAIIIDRIIAETEQQARELSNTQAAKEHPIVTLMFEGKDVVPPYMKEPTATLAQWKVTELPLNDTDRELAKQGELGPAHASNAGKATTLANPV